MTLASFEDRGTPLLVGVATSGFLQVAGDPAHYARSDALTLESVALM